jgi:hypothetical protein
MIMRAFPHKPHDALCRLTEFPNGGVDLRFKNRLAVVESVPYPAQLATGEADKAQQLRKLHRL